MAKLKSSTATSKALVGIWTILLTAFTLATLYLARDVLIPLALAGLLTFLLAPLVTRVERWLGRVGGVLFVVMLILGATGFGGWVLSRQLVDLATKLPDYKENIQSGGQTGRIMNAQLLHEPLPVLFDRFDANTEFGPQSVCWPCPRQ